MTIPSHTLNDGTTIPAIGLGTYNLLGSEGDASISRAIDSGYRLLDTALNYKNEGDVGEGIRASSVSRDELFVTTKLPGRHHGYDSAIASLEESLGNLGLDHVELYLIHWPLPKVDKYVDTWRALIELRERGLTRSIGVSNFTPTQLQRLIDETGVTPAVNQVELHPNFPQGELREFHAAHGIRTQSWSPLGSRHADFTTVPTIVDVAAAHGVTPSQAVLRWHIQLGSVPIPRSGDAGRQRENLDVFGFELTDAEITAISALESGRLWDGDPDTHEEF
ncbi:diketogulonate reductase-like aldo/keto reductase [Homoserinimonas aerilata]|uniref:Diketogulonate reductase-like aldo/keto reductase n=1 Tax=Homoserinimonas aerilata TaxID=1162970 RepID=A0A542YH33_9MICO|nr:aldo/keto reductase [Homoserinimonas aerilata]TQL47378.1 diketogulonate reductase-like aldo/keto reductase [Homoserinimonas aerilata]